MQELIDLDELERRVKQLGKPTPFQVIDLIADMYKTQPYILRKATTDQFDLGTQTIQYP